MPAANIRLINVWFGMVTFFALTVPAVHAQPNCADWNANNEFFKAADVDDVIHCLDAGADPNKRGEAGIKPLHHTAAYGSDPAMVNALLDAGADPHDLTMALFLAASYNFDPTVAVALIDSGANVNAEMWDGRTPLHGAAIDSENPAVIAVLIARGADPNATADLIGEAAPLHEAGSYNDNPDVIHALIDGGADVEARDTSGQTPLHWAAMRSNHPAVIAALLHRGADPDARDHDEWTPLHLAAMANDTPDVIDTLIDGGADPNAQAKGRITPLQGAATLNENPAVTATLLDHGADPDARTEDGKTAWDFAQENPALEGTDVLQRLRDAHLQGTPQR